MIMFIAFGCSSNNQAPLREVAAPAAGVNKRDHNGFTALTLAAIKGDGKAVEDLLSRGADPNLPNRDGFTPLALAASNVEIVRALLKAGADPNTLSQNLDTAIAGASAETASMLLAAGAKVDVPDRDGRTALIGAAARGDAATVRLLLDAGAQENLQDTAFGKTALMYAAQNNHPAVADVLLKAGADTQLTDHRGWTAMDYAAMQMQTDAVKALLQREATTERR